MGGGGGGAGGGGMLHSQWSGKREDEAEAEGSPWPWLWCEMCEDARDHFDRLPNSVVLIIFNRLAEIKALGRCAAVSKRFNSLVPQVTDVIVKVDCVISSSSAGGDTVSGGGGNRFGRGFIGALAKFVVCGIVRPLQSMLGFLSQAQAQAARRELASTEASHHSPGEVLRSFREIRHLTIELPGGELSVDRGVLLRWCAEFGSTLDSCVILGATSYSDSPSPGLVEASSSHAQALSVRDMGLPETFYTNGGLKLRVVWTISSLIAASARHFLLQQIVAEHPTLRSLVLTDADGQGVLRMGEQQLNDFRNTPLAPSASTNRTQVPALNMKLWYAPTLDIQGIGRMEGATLVSIRPSDQPTKKDTEGSVFGAFGEPYGTAAKEMLKKRTYLLEMNSF